MKALEKAAKDRLDARTEPAAAAPAASSAKAELSLEPLAAETPAALRPEAAPRSVTPPRAPAAAAAREQAQAATVLQAASRPPEGGVVGAYVRTHPLVVLGTVAGLVAVGFGVYMYLQILHPNLIVRLAPPAPKGPLPPLAQAPATTPAPLPAAPLLQASAAEAASPAAAPTPRERPQEVVPAAPPVETPRNTIVVSRASPEPALNPLHTEAYAALEANRLEPAKRLYNQLLQAEPKNIDALLGLAAIAMLEGNSDEATRHYLQILELEPRHALAQSGLIGLLGRADPLAAESRLRQLIAREPSAYLYFTLGNLYADQSQWAAAQHAYFQAHHLEPANPDYAYNLAVGLEHVSQPRLALGFYQRAVQLAAAKGRANFNLAQAQERISRLASQVE